MGKKNNDKKQNDQSEFIMEGHKTEFEESLENQIIEECIKLTKCETSTARDIIYKTRELLTFRSKKPSMA